MRRTAILRLLCFSFLFSGALAVYSECFLAGTYHDLAAEHASVSIHCPDALFVPNIQIDLPIQSRGRDLAKVLPSIDEKLNSFVLVARFEDHYFRQSISQQDLFRFEEVYRL